MTRGKNFDKLFAQRRDSSTVEHQNHNLLVEGSNPPLATIEATVRGGFRFSEKARSAQMNFEPIGYFHGGPARKYEAPRQGVFAGGAGRVELLPGRNFETALRDLEGFSRIWLLFAFDRNGATWRPTAHPPVTAPGRARVGVFASRAPYRPNPIGLSCVRLVAVDGRVVEVDEADLLDGTPVLDIKPYVPAADAFPDGVSEGTLRNRRRQAVHARYCARSERNGCARCHHRSERRRDLSCDLPESDG